MRLTRLAVCALCVCALLGGCAQDKPVLSLASSAALERGARFIMERDGYCAPLPVEDDEAALNQLVGGACDAALLDENTPLPKGVARVERVAAGALHAVSGIADIAAWRGGAVAIMAKQDTDEADILLALLDSYYIKGGDTRIYFLTQDEAEAAFADGRADAVLLIAPEGDALVARLLERGGLCAIPANKSELLAQRFPSLIPYELRADAYGITQPVETAALTAALVMSADADEEARSRMVAAAAPLALSAADR